ncbi:MAG: hypothetical protein ACK4WD_10270 [Flavobacteriales bacterium]|jgi:hypothetical protein
MMTIVNRVAAVVILVLISTISNGQCAMCRATAETASENVDKGIGEGLNSGILYLMGAPYILLAIVGVIFFRKKIAALFK